MMKNLKNYLIKSNETLRNILLKININGKGICIVTDANKVVGVVTDGDVRRFILKNSNLSIKASKIMNTNFIYANNDTTEELLKKLLQNNKFLPYLNKNGSLKKIFFQRAVKATPLAKPYFGGNEIKYLKNCIDTNWISSQGEFLSRFEKKFKEIFKINNNLTTSSGTTALHLAMATLGIKKNDEVLVPNITFAASINTIIQTGANPVIVEIDKNNLCMSFAEAQKKITKKTKAILLVHLYGFMPDMKKFIIFAKKNKLLIIEDCAEAIGSYYKNKHAGSFGDAAAFSFFGNKTITTGEGGMLAFKNKKFLEKAKILRDHGMSPIKKYWHVSVGFNYRMTNLQAAIGLAQLENINKILKKKLLISKMYKSYLLKNEFISIPKLKNNVKNIYWFFIIKIKKSNLFIRDNLINYLKNRNIETRSTFYPLNSMRIYKKYSKGKYNVSKDFFNSCICLPSWTKIKKEEIFRICKILNKYFK